MRKCGLYILSVNNFVSHFGSVNKWGLYPERGGGGGVI